MVFLSEGNIYVNVLVAFCLQLPMVKKDTKFEAKFQSILVTRHLLKYE